MTGFSPVRNRKVIPRWRPFQRTLFLGELDSANYLSKPREYTIDYLSRKISNWRNDRTAIHAADALGTAIVLGRELEVTDIANYFVQDCSDNWKFGSELANRVLNPTICSRQSSLYPTEIQVKEQCKLVKKYRNLLRLESKDPITWVDLSLVYASIGIRVKAEKCMNVALHLARENRFVIRSASRLWIHLDEPEKAHQIIIQSHRTKHDPWLLAAEIATGETANVTPTFTTLSRRILKHKVFDAKHLSELASAMATLELESGNIRRARKYFAQSLEQPTENSIAQAVWTSQEKIAIQFETESLNNSKSFEASYRYFMTHGDWKNAINQCLNWQFDQPFSSIPGIQGSYLAAVVLEDYSTCEKFAEFSLRANPGNSTLLNNLACAQINLGELKKAENTLSKINILQDSSETRIVVKVTRGLLSTRKGNINQGRKLYEEAIEDAQKIRNQRILSHAYTYYALEGISNFGSTSSTVVKKALNYLKRQNDSISEVLAKRLETAHAQARSKANFESV